MVSRQKVSVAALLLLVVVVGSANAAAAANPKGQQRLRSSLNRNTHDNLINNDQQQQQHEKDLKEKAASFRNRYEPRFARDAEQQATTISSSSKRDRRRHLGKGSKSMGKNHNGGIYWSLTNSPTSSPTTTPTISPTLSPTTSPTSVPTTSPTTSPTVVPTASPTMAPAAAITVSPTGSPTGSPTSSPTKGPTIAATAGPTGGPTVSPTTGPTTSPTMSPVAATSSPTVSPTTSPTLAPMAATESPTESPMGSNSGTSATASPTVGPSASPTASPTESPVKATDGDSNSRTDVATASPTRSPTPQSTVSPTVSPSQQPTTSPTSSPEEGNIGATGSVAHSFPNIVFTSSTALTDADLQTLEIEADEYIRATLPTVQPAWELKALNVEAETINGNSDSNGATVVRLSGIATFANPAPSRNEFWGVLRSVMTLDAFQDLWGDATDIEVEEDTSSNLSANGSIRSVDPGASASRSETDNTVVVATAMSGSALLLIFLVLALRRRGKKDEALFTSFDGSTEMASKEPVVTLIPDVRELGVSATRSLSEQSSYDESPIGVGLVVDTDLSCVEEEGESDMDDASRSFSRPPMLDVERMCDDESLASSEYTEIFSEQSIDAGNSIKDHLALGAASSPVESVGDDLLVDIGVDFQGDDHDAADDDEILGPPSLTPKPAHVLILGDDGDVDLGASLTAHKWMSNGPKNDDNDDSSRSSSMSYHSDKECQIEISDNGTVVVRPKGSPANTNTLPSYQPDLNSGNVDSYFEQNMSLLSNNSSVTTAEDIVLLSGGTPLMERAEEEADRDMLLDGDASSQDGKAPQAIPMQALDEPDQSPDNNLPPNGDGPLTVNTGNDENGMKDLPPATYSDSPPHRTRPLLERMSVPAAGRRRNHPSHRVWI